MTKEQYKCHNCQEPCMRGDPSLLRAVGKLYHKQCFNCNYCHTSVIDKFYIMDSIENDVILCEKDYYQYSNLKCHQCNQLIKENNYQTIGIYKYHKYCLHCPGCTIINEQDITLERFDYNNRPYCRYHYSLIKGTECIGCGQAVLYEYLENNGKWHKECFMIKKYWHISLIDLYQQPEYKNDLIQMQDNFQTIRCNIWKELSIFEDITSKIISSIVILNQSSAFKKEYEACFQLTKQINILFSVLDLVFFKYLSHLSCELPVQKLSNQLVYFIDILCQTNTVQDVERLMKMSTILSQFIRDIIKLSLQQTIILERNSGQNNLIHQVTTIFKSKSFKITMDTSCLDHHSGLIDMALTRLGVVLNTTPIEGKRPDETFTLYKPQSILNRPSLSYQKRMVNSTSNIHYFTPDTTTPNLNRSKSTQKPHVIDTDFTSPKNKRMESIKRALTTTRSKRDSPITRSTSIFGSRREQKSTSAPPLSISLPDMEQIHSSPPLSPPSANQQIWTIPTWLPDLTIQQDSIIRHIAILHIESHVSLEVISIDDLLSLLDFNKRSLWGKLKNHILTPTNENSPTISNEKKIGVSLSNTSNGSLNIYKMRDSENIKNWKSHCSSVVSCFSCHSLAPNFLKDCILAMIDGDVKTEGIFRKNGNIRGLKEMCDQLNEGQHQQDYTEFFKDQQLVQLAAFLKRYLRELPEPLLTFKLHKLFTLSNNKVEDDIKLIHYAICTLPKINRDILLLILSYLNWVAKHSEDNKMDYENLARVMAPNILYKKQATDVAVCHREIRVIATMIEHYETLIQVPKDFTALLEHTKMSDYLATNSVDLTCSKHFVKTFGNLSKVKKDIISSVLPPSPSTSSV